MSFVFFFFQAEDGIRDYKVTGVQTCALPISGIGGFLNVTFGNAAELIIAIFLLAEGLQEVVKASIIGSILGNLLLVLGLSMVVGGIGRKKQRFNRTAANA